MNVGDKIFNIWFFSKDDNIINKIEHFGNYESARILAEKKIKEEKDVYADYEIETNTLINPYADLLGTK